MHKFSYIVHLGLSEKLKSNIHKLRGQGHFIFLDIQKLIGLTTLCIDIKEDILMDGKSKTDCTFIEEEKSSTANENQKKIKNG